MADEPLILPLPWDRPPLSMNQRLHWAVKARLTREIREVVAVVARHHKLPKGLDQVTVTLHYQPSTVRRRDVDNTATIKPAIDGLVDYGLIPDDNSQHVTAVAYKVEPVLRDGGEDAPRVWLTITTRPGSVGVRSATHDDPGGTRGN